MLKKYILSLFFMMSIAGSAYASPTRFTFNTPAFGGSPFAAAYYMSMADRQNQNQKITNKEDPSSLEGFKKQLQTQLLSTTAAKISKLVTDSENPLTQPVNYAVDNLTITVTPINPDTGQYQIIISDGTGTTTIDVGGAGGLL